MSMQKLRFPEDPIGEVAEHTAEKNAKADRPAGFSDLPGKDDETCRDDEREDSQEDGEVRANVEGSTAIGGVIEAKEFTDHLDRISPIKKGDGPPLGGLIETEEQEREEQDRST